MKTNRLRSRDCVSMYIKSALLLGSLAAIYVLLVFVAHSWFQAIPLAILLGCLASAIGLNIQHDGGHKAYSQHGWINTLAAMTLDMLGGSSYCWRWKHAVFHHTYVNIEGHDTDIDFGALARLTPYQKRLSFHRWQHFYLWALYGFMVLRWHLFGDFRDLVAGTIGAGGPRFTRPKGWDLAVFLGGKAFFFTFAFIIPMLFRPVLSVAMCYVIAASVMGISMSVVFQLAHCVEEAEFIAPPSGAEHGQMENAWAIHQVESTVNFARNNPVASWLLGGLNFQIEHHLLPQISHINYPAITKLVEETCKEYGVKYAAHKSIWAGLTSHYRWLRAMGQRAPV